MAKKLQQDFENIDENGKFLLLKSAEELIKELSANDKLSHVKQTAFEHYDKKRKETVHVQVTVTRDENDFLEPFQTEEMKRYQPNN